MAIKKYRGNLTMLGNATFSSTSRLYSVIEIGNNSIRRVQVGDILDNYLSRALNHSGDVELEMVSRLSPVKLTIFMLLAGIACFPILYVAGSHYLISNDMGNTIGMIAFTIIVTNIFLFFHALKKEDERPAFSLIAVNIDGKRYTN